jgi:hypothetical protein
VNCPTPPTSDCKLAIPETRPVADKYGNWYVGGEAAPATPNDTLLHLIKRGENTFTTFTTRQAGPLFSSPVVNECTSSVCPISVYVGAGAADNRAYILRGTITGGRRRGYLYACTPARLSFADRCGPSNFKAWANVQVLSDRATVLGWNYHQPDP